MELTDSTSIGNGSAFHNGLVETLLCLVIICFVFVVIYWSTFNRILKLLVFKIYVMIGKYELALNLLKELSKDPKYSLQFKKQYAYLVNDPDCPLDIKEEADSVYKRWNNNQIEDTINTILKQIDTESYDQKEIRLVEIDDELEKYTGTNRNHFENRIREVRLAIKNEKVRELSESVNQYFIDKDYKSALSLLSNNHLSIIGLNSTEISSEISTVQKELEKTINSLLIVDSIADAKTIILIASEIEVFSNHEFLIQLTNKVVDFICEKFKGFIKELKIEEAKKIIDDNVDLLPKRKTDELNEQVRKCEASKQYKVKKLYSLSISSAKKNDFANAWSKYDEATALNGLESFDIKNEIQKLELPHLLYKIDSAIASGEVNVAEELIINCEKKYPHNLDLLNRSNSINTIRQDRENKYLGPQLVVTPRFNGLPYFNVPKKEGEGEDANPYVDTDSNRNWGIISVFDGMGGAGGRKYTNSETQKVHTSAYWAARIVREAVEDVVTSRALGDDPLLHYQSALKQAIKKKLAEAIKLFPETLSNVQSKMIRILPTTIASCLYEICDNQIRINCFWAGDSRIFMLDKKQLHFLTIDDSDAPDGDPFSPANMDLAMNNTVCYDRDFKIHQSTLRIPYSQESPIVLVAATDGCFGYYKNPIEFEYMIRNAFSESDDFDAILPHIKNDIIDNIQQDDFSMSMVVIGETQFSNFRDIISQPIYSSLFVQFYEWFNKQNETRKQVEIELSEVDKQIVKDKEEKKNIETKRALLAQRTSELLSSGGSRDDIVKNIFPELEKIEDSESAHENSIPHNIELKNTLKKQLETLQIEAESANMEWYMKYKEQSSIVQQINDSI